MGRPLMNSLFIRVLLFNVAFDEYAAQVPSVANSRNKRGAKVQFRDFIVSRDGIPVVIVNTQKNER